MRTTLIPLRKHIRQALQEKREMLIYNISALKFIRDTQMPTTAGVGEDEVGIQSDIGLGSSRTLKRKRVKI
jgi:U3 small nucleolar RNA-associated protein 12